LKAGKILKSKRLRWVLNDERMIFFVEISLVKRDFFMRDGEGLLKE